jgi:hypothetical protein
LPIFHNPENYLLRPAGDYPVKNLFRRSKEDSQESLPQPPVFERTEGPVTPELYASLVEEALGYALHGEPISIILGHRFAAASPADRTNPDKINAMREDSIRQVVTGYDDWMRVGQRLDRMYPPDESLEEFHQALTLCLREQFNAFDSENNYFVATLTSKDRKAIDKLGLHSEVISTRAGLIRDKFKHSIVDLYNRGGPEQLLSTGLTASILLWLELDDLSDEVAKIE